MSQYYFMRVFSEINNQPLRPNTVPPSQPMNSIQQIGSSAESAQQSNSRSYQSFRLQPAQFFADNHKKTPPIKHKEHIRVDTDSESQKAKTVQIEPQGNVRPRRRKIFDHKNGVQTLKEGPVLKLVNDSKPTVSARNDKPQRLNKLASQLVRGEGYSPPDANKYRVQIPSQQAVKIYSANESLSHLNQTSNLNDTKQRIIRRYKQQDRTYEQERLRKILNKPILMQQHPAERTKPSIIDPQLQFILKNYPKVVQRLEKNEHDIAYLQQQLQQQQYKRMQEEEAAKERLKRIEFNKRLVEGDNVNKTFTKQSNKRQTEERKQQIRQGEKLKIELQKEQAKRLEQLIQQNRHLYAKVIQHRNRNSRANPPDQYEKIEQRIQELRSMRASYLNPQSKSSRSISPNARNLVNLDISVIKPKLTPSPLSNPRINVMAPTRDIRYASPSYNIHHYNPQILNSSMQTVKRQEGYEVYGKNY